jgi:hypothetical protein
MEFPYGCAEIAKRWWGSKKIVKAFDFNDSDTEQKFVSRACRWIKAQCDSGLVSAYYERGSYEPSFFKSDVEKLERLIPGMDDTKEIEGLNTGIDDKDRAVSVEILRGVLYGVLAEAKKAGLSQGKILDGMENSRRFPAWFSRTKVALWEFPWKPQHVVL